MATLAQKRSLDRTVGGPLCAVLNVIACVLHALLRRDHSLSRPPRRILVIKLVGLGTIVQSTQMLAALKEEYPESVLTFACCREVAPLVERLPHVDEVTVLDDSTWARLLLSVLRFLFGVWRRRPGLVIDLEVHSNFSTILAALTCAHDRAGLYLTSARSRRCLYTHLVYYNQLRHVQEVYRQLGRVLGVKPAVGKLVAPRIADAEREAVTELLAGRLEGERRLLLVNPNAGELCLERRWPPDRFARVMEQFAPADDVLVVMIGSPAEREYIESVRQMLPEGLLERVVNSAGRLGFGEFLALLQRADVVLTNDSGPLHLAVALGTSTVSVWGPETPDAFGPLTGDHRVIWAAPYCSPCLHRVDLPPCGGDNICMQRITWREVAAGVAELLGCALDLRGGPREAEGDDGDFVAGRFRRGQRGRG